jgi:hypothetical protein
MANGSPISRNELESLAFWSRNLSKSMNYTWPLPHPDRSLGEALDIALHYLEATGQANAGDDTRHMVASSIFAAWLEGTRHRIRLANAGIEAVQKVRLPQKVETVWSCFPRLT